MATQEKSVESKVNIKLENAVSLIPIYTGEEDIYQFITACDLAVDAVDSEYLPLLNKYILTKLKRKASEITKYRDASKWANIKQLLLSAFESKYTPATLQVQLIQ